MAEILRKSDHHRIIFARWSVSLVLVAMLISAIPAAADSESEAEKDLAAAMRREVVLGDLKGALEQYRSIAERHLKSTALTARALYQIGQCLEKLGQRTEAYNVYTQVVARYPAQFEAALLARSQLANWENAVPGPMNLRFDQGVAGKLPPAWFVPALPNEADQWAQVRVTGCMDDGTAGRCAVVLVPDNAPVHASNLMQSFSAAAYRGKTIRLSGWIRLDTTEPGDRAQMWLSVDRGNGQKGFLDDMSDRPVRSSQWTACQIETKVDTDASFVKFGVMSIGRGRVWVDRVSFEIVR